MLLCALGEPLRSEWNYWTRSFVWWSMPATLYQRITLIFATLFFPALIQAGPEGHRSGPAKAGHYVRLGAADCVMERENASWMRTALDNWESVRRQDLHVEKLRCRGSLARFKR